jgi:hypothetical protein
METPAEMPGFFYFRQSRNNSNLASKKLCAVSVVPDSYESPDAGESAKRGNKDGHILNLE